MNFFLVYWFIAIIAAIPVRAAPASATGSIEQPIQTVYFEVESASQSINGSAITALHEGAGVNFMFLATNDSIPLYYNPNTQILYQSINGTEGIKLTFGIQQDFAVLGGGDASVSLKDYYLNFDGKDDFVACKDVGDPYRYSQSSYAVMYYEDAPDTCIPFKLKVSEIYMVA